MKVFLTAAGVLIAVAMILAVVTFLVMVLVNIAFPLLDFGYWQALALLGLGFLIGLPAMKS
jgi:hypothetical protein